MLFSMERQAGGAEDIVADATAFGVRFAQLNSTVRALLA